jgi:2-polyprenyl-3-methyl-5-hydroxy-6-metoxy-1,4-benzoquinol methylase
MTIARLGSVAFRSAAHVMDVAKSRYSMIDLPEDCYGRRKRFSMLREVVAEVRPRRVLDVGCGTGAMLTRPLAEAFPNIEVIGIDTDGCSVACANAQSLPPNLTICMPDKMPADTRFELVIASEVLEHVDRPDDFLRWIRSRLSPNGTLILTIPNGYGPFEFMMLMAVLLHGPALKRLGERLQRRLSGPGSVTNAAAKQTLAVSPHVNFFRLPHLRLLFSMTGLRIERYRPGTLLAGPGIETVLRFLRAIDWNARIVDRLPHWCASGWFLVLRRTEPVKVGDWRRGAIASVRRRLNQRRWGVGDTRDVPVTSIPSYHGR